MLRYLACSSLLFTACSEAPRMQPQAPLPDGPDLAQPSAADLLGYTGPVLDLAPAAPIITAVSPRRISTLGGAEVTITGSGFDAPVVFLNHLSAAVKEASATSITFVAPPQPGVMGDVGLVVKNRGGGGLGASLAAAGNDGPKIGYYLHSVSFNVRTHYRSAADRGELYGGAVGDLDNDGNIDIVVGNNQQGGINVYLGDADGSFRPVVPYNGIGQPYQGLQILDLDGDGKLDVLFAAYNNNYSSWWRGAGNGTFSTGGQNFTSGVGSDSSPMGLAAGDFNGDNKIDFVTVHNQGSPNVNVFLTNGAGSVTSRSFRGYTGYSNPYQAAVGDFNKDDKLDFVVANQGSSTLSVFTGNGAGGFSGPQVLSCGSNPRWLVTGDFNADGYLDIANTNINSNTVSVFFNSGAGGFNAPLYLTTVNGPLGIDAADLDGDGDTDLVVANQSTPGAGQAGTGVVSMFLNPGDGSFGPRQDFPVTGSNPWVIKVASFGKRDRKPDIFVTNQSAGISVLTNTSQ